MVRAVDSRLHGNDEGAAGMTGAFRFGGVLLSWWYR